MMNGLTREDEEYDNANIYLLPSLFVGRLHGDL